MKRIRDYKTDEEVLIDRRLYRTLKHKIAKDQIGELYNNFLNFELNPTASNTHTLQDITVWLDAFLLSVDSPDFREELNQYTSDTGDVDWTTFLEKYKTSDYIIDNND